jgi:hypothetical protein
MSGRPNRLGTSLGWLAGPVAWAGFFLIAYASESLVCTRLGAPGWHGAIVALAGCGALALIAVALRTAFGRGEANTAGFLARTGVALAWLSLVAIAWTGLSALMLQACS